ncbi:MULTISPECIES: alpha/beta fold hydrolase [unclassified Sphingobacterium]|uniref:alpha/beta fold hydrolase n=1 Tax=unclassified Sphingobacterium TaxID=2609468 RepID=UPI0025FCC353|nr:MULTISPECIES: alpha/beta hydrolase [unclassified Sphingobacterium]
MILVNFVFAQKKITDVKRASLPFIETSDHVKLFVKTAGTGTVCIFLHGGPGAWSKSFEEMGGHNLEKKLKMVYFDQRGCGRSDTSAERNYSLDRMVDDIEDIRRALGTEKIYLLSHSFGGVIAVNYAKKYPNHLFGLILANSTLDLTSSLEAQIQHVNELINTNFEATPADSILSMFSLARRTLSNRGLGYKMLSDDKKTTDMLDHIDDSYGRSNDFAKHVWGYKIYTEDFRQETKDIKVPVLVIAGKKDYAIGVDHYRKFNFPNQKTVLINGGHVLYYERNKEFTEAIFSFIK